MGVVSVQTRSYVFEQWERTCPRHATVITGFVCGGEERGEGVMVTGPLRLVAIWLPVVRLVRLTVCVRGDCN